MDRNGFRNRMKQYKKAREENPGLKYWEWKNIPKYDEGTGNVTYDPIELQRNLQKVLNTTPEGEMNPFYNSLDDTYGTANIPEVMITAPYTRKASLTQQAKQGAKAYYDAGKKAAPLLATIPLSAGILGTASTLGWGTAMDLVDIATNPTDPLSYIDKFDMPTFKKVDPMSKNAKPVSDKIFVDDAKVAGSTIVKPRYLDYGTLSFEDNILNERPQWVKDVQEFYDTDVMTRERKAASTAGVFYGLPFTKKRSELTFNYERPVYIREYLDDVDFGGYANDKMIVIDKNSSFAPDETLVHEGAHFDQSGGKTLPFNLMANPDTKEVIANVMANRYTDPKYRPFLLSVLDDAYEFTEDFGKTIHETLEKGATNREMRYNIWLKNNKPNVDELDNIIDEMTDDDIIYMLTQTNGYSRNVHKNLLEKGKNKKEVAAHIRTALKTVPTLSAPIILNSTNDDLISFAEGGEVEPDPLEVLERSKPKFHGIPLAKGNIDGVFSPIDIPLATLPKVWPVVNKWLPNYGQMLGALVGGDDGLTVNRKAKPLTTKPIDADVKEHYEDIVIPLRPLEDYIKQIYLQNPDNFVYNVYADNALPDNRLADFNNTTGEVRIKESILNSPISSQILAHEINGHRSDRSLPRSKEARATIDEAFNVRKKPLSKESKLLAEKEAETTRLSYNFYKYMKDNGLLLIKKPMAKTKAYQDYVLNATDDQIDAMLGNSTVYSRDYKASGIDYDKIRWALAYAPEIAAGLIIPQHLLSNDKESKQWI